MRIFISKKYSSQNVYFCKTKSDKNIAIVYFEKLCLTKIIFSVYFLRLVHSAIVEKYHIGTRQTLFNWMDKYVNEKDLVSLPDESENPDTMAKKSPEEKLRELEAENKRLQKALELERLRSKAYDTMINLAESTFNIPIRKKSGTKQ